ncbi:sensor histidine kinase [Litoreibacter ponti]|uniref:sensor histidine kinase n=1 Tax=Litoreibacter ponti TaxID=1510457 RepID=UPI001304F526|nr:ATP-binding protein [Litoreibacter ponti]
MPHLPRLTPVLLISALLAALIVTGVYQMGLRAGLDRLERSGEIAVQQAGDRITAQLESYKELANFLARHPRVMSQLDGRSDMVGVSEFLLRSTLIAGARSITVLDEGGRVLASSTLEDDPGFIGRALGQRDDVVAARTGRLGVYHSAERDGARGYYFTRSVLGPDSRPIGFVTVKVNVDQLEYEWRIDENVVTFFDAYGVAFVSNRLELALSFDPDLKRQEIVGSAPYPPESLTPFPEHLFERAGGRTIWAFDGGGVMPERALVVSRTLPLVEMTTRAFMDIAPAVGEARLQALLTAALLAAFGLGLLAFWQSRQRIADQLRIEAEANAVLEARVARRNAQLQQVQDDLVQASKLTALGHMSAEISHELNQPLSAIQNYAENAKKLIARDRAPDAKDNLSLISEQTERMGRIITNLRGFARKETEPLEDVDVGEVLRASLGLADQRARAEDVTLSLSLPDAPVFVEAGAVRLQQVVVNLLSNAMDAMEGQERREITVSLAQQTGQAVITVEDTGPGLADPTRAFEPFYTTKDVGASNGLGLGLSISYGIVGSFGGTLAVENPENGGARFTIALPLLDRQEAAE